MLDGFDQVLEQLYKGTAVKYQKGESPEVGYTDPREKISYRWTPLYAVPGTELESRFPVFLVLVLEDRSPTHKRLHLLLNTFPWKGDRDELVIPPSVLLRLELSVESEESGGDKFQRRELQAYMPSTGLFRGLSLMGCPLAYAPVVFELMARAHELASSYPAILNLRVRAVG